MDCLEIGNATNYAAIVYNQMDLFFYLISHEKIRYSFPVINWRLLSHRVAASNCRDFLEFIKKQLALHSAYYVPYTHDEPRLSEIIGYAAMHNHPDIIDYFISTHPDESEVINIVARRIAADYKHDDLIAHLNRKNSTWFAGLFGANNNTTKTPHTDPLLRTTNAL